MDHEKNRERAIIILKTGTLGAVTGLIFGIILSFIINSMLNSDPGEYIVDLFLITAFLITLFSTGMGMIAGLILGALRSFKR